jgi:hypothetical protein
MAVLARSNEAIGMGGTSHHGANHRSAVPGPDGRSCIVPSFSMARLDHLHDSLDKCRAPNFSTVSYSKQETGRSRKMHLPSYGTAFCTANNYPSLHLSTRRGMENGNHLQPAGLASRQGQEDRGASMYMYSSTS